MNNKKTSQKILDYIKKGGQTSGSELSDYLEISDRAVRKQLKNLLENGEVYKIGKPPKVFYLLEDRRRSYAEDVDIDKNNKKIIEDNYLIITPSGERKEGWEGFVYWCGKTNQKNIEKMAVDYVNTVKKYEAYKKSGFIDGKSKIKESFETIHLDELFYVDFYSIERFGKTKLGQLLLYAKQSQDKKMIKEVMKEIDGKIDRLIKKYSVDAVGFIPPTVKREVQFMKELEKGLSLKTKKINITKVKTAVVVPQKTLNKIEDRVENARNTIIVEERAVFDNILLIDDAVGSGATLNETAGKIKEKGICKGKIIGLSVTGSFKGFDVISEV
jgi:biotin operon repressor